MFYLEWFRGLLLQVRDMGMLPSGRTNRGDCVATGHSTERAVGGSDLHGAVVWTAIIGLLIYTGSFAIGPLGVFLLFGCMTAIALGYFYWKVPETKGRSLQELEQTLTGHTVG